MNAGKGDLKTIANGLFPSGFNAAALTPEGRDEVRAAVDVILRLSDSRNARLTLALEMLDKAAAHIEHKDAQIAQMLEALRTIIYASDKCQGHRNCAHDMTGWTLAREIISQIDDPVGQGS
jgi:hypothetical protein